MLSNAWMGALALGILWVNTLLVVAAALKRAVPLLRRARAFRPLKPGEIGTGIVVGRLAGDDPRAELAIEQTGRVATGKARAIVWHDRGYASQLFASTLSGQDVRYALAPSPEVEVWPSPARVARAHACPGTPDFDGLFGEAGKARGARRTTRAILGGDVDVYVFGRVERRDDAYAIVAPPGGKVVVAEIDPRRAASSRATLIALVFVPLIVLGAAVATALALTPPHFDGTVSKVGGLLGLVFFLLVLPAGTAIRDFARMPHERILRGRWADPEGRTREVRGAVAGG